MKPTNSDGWSSVLAVAVLLFGLRARGSAAHVTTNLAAARANPKVSDEDALIGELMDGVMAGLNRRLAFEAWADAR